MFTLGQRWLLGVKYYRKHFSKNVLYYLWTAPKQKTQVEPNHLKKNIDLGIGNSFW